MDGVLQDIYERPARARRIIEAVRAEKLGDVRAPLPCDVTPVLRVHDRHLVRFLQEAWPLWSAQVGGNDAIPYVHSPRGVPSREPESINGKLAYFTYDAVTPLTSGSWSAALDAVAVTMSGWQLLQKGESTAFSLCRPPGHHSTYGQFGGYGLFNNVAVAAQAAIDVGARRVAVLDVDVHHGNGTQDIFYRRNDVLYVSIHADPRFSYPFFMGHADEIGAGEGEGANLNLPLPRGTRWDTYEPALGAALTRISRFAPDVVFVSLGVDTFDGDPTGSFKLRTPDYLLMGAAIATLRKPTLFVMEGGYSMATLGSNVVNVLKGFQCA
jgi:acetoin utilization deacetylase AcuC-like enzyme